MDCNGVQLSIKTGVDYFESEEIDAYGMSVGKSLWEIPCIIYRCEVTCEVK
jgi:hypothetical protein